MSKLRAFLLVLASVSLLTPLARAQSLPATPGLYSLGVGLSLGDGWGLRSDYSPGFLGTPASTSAPDERWSGRARSSLYADWFPFTSSGFRVVGGLTLNDTSYSPLRASASGGVGPSAPSASGTSAALGLGTHNPMTSTYFGIGFSQLGMGDRGLGLYADMGVTVGTLGADTDAGSGGQPTLSAEGWRVQSNGWFGFTYLPSVSLGLIYRY